MKEISLCVNSVHEAMWALQNIYPRFKSWVLEQGQHGLVYEVFIGDWQIGEEHLGAAVGGADVTVVPIVGASGGNLGKIILGVALIGAGLVFSGGLLGLSSTSLLLAGGAMLLSGIAGMLQPKNKDEDGNPNSLVFGNTSEVTRVGAAKQMVFGTHICSGIIISARIRTFQLA